MSGKVIGIFVTGQAGLALQSRHTARAIAGKGLEGDRYADETGFYSQNPTTPGARELTLIDATAVKMANEAVDGDFDYANCRRNLITEGADLESLLGRRFTIGNVTCEGVRDCPPCVHLEELTGLKVMKPLLHTGGLRARIVKGGEIALGDPIADIGPADGEFAKRGAI
jgi:MOSC domain-containing protein YiiM